MFQNFLPEIYRSFFSEELKQLPLQELKATCFNCIKAKPTESFPFQAHLKCCTYHPFLPNFLVGAILKSKSTSPQSRAAIEKKIKDREYALPLGMIAPVSLQIAFNQRLPGEFGQREDWACPYLDPQTAHCGIWKHRNSQCTTYFCKSDYGQMGQSFWQEVKTQLSVIERSYALSILRHMGFDEDNMAWQIGLLDRRDGSFAETTVSFILEKHWQKAWMSFANDPLKFYVTSFEIFEELKQKDDLQNRSEILLAASRGIVF